MNGGVASSFLGACIAEQRGDRGAIERFLRWASEDERRREQSRDVILRQLWRTVPNEDGRGVMR